MKDGASADAIEACFRELLAQNDYRSVSVSSICERMGLARKAFYLYYESKEDILRTIFVRDVVQSITELLGQLEFTKIRKLDMSLQAREFQAVYDDGAFYRSLVVPRRGGDEAFVKVACKAFYDLNRLIFDQTGFIQDPQRADYAAYYFAAAKAELMRKWICDGYAVPVDQLVKLYLQMVLPYWDKIPGGGGFIAAFSEKRPDVRGSA